MLTNAAGQVLVAQRIDNPGAAWQMPQGGVDDGEDPRAAAMRELKEEIGTANAVIIAEIRDWLFYDLPSDLAPRLWGGRFLGQRQKWYLLRFMGEDREIDIATKHPEFSRWMWTEPERLPELIVPFKRPLYEAILAEFLPILRSSI